MSKDLTEAVCMLLWAMSGCFGIALAIGLSVRFMLWLDERKAENQKYSIN